MPTVLGGIIGFFGMRSIILSIVFFTNVIPIILGGVFIVGVPVLIFTLLIRGGTSIGTKQARKTSNKYNRTENSTVVRKS
jgi:hypothetical protein